MHCLGKNRSHATLRAYRADILQFITFLTETDVTKMAPADVRKIDCLEYLFFLAKKGLTGIARARKLAAIREYFRFLEGVGVIAKSPTVGIETPKAGEAYESLPSARRVYENALARGRQPPRLCHPADVSADRHPGLRACQPDYIDNIDFLKPAITVRGKGGVEREIALEKCGMQALKNYLAGRGDSLSGSGSF